MKTSASKRKYKKYITIPNSIILPNVLKCKVQELLLTNPPKFSYKETFFYWFLHLIISNRYNRKNFYDTSDFTPLNASILRRYNSNYNQYFEYLKKNKIIDSLNHKNFKKSPNVSKRFKLSEEIVNNIVSKENHFTLVNIDEMKKNTIIISDKITDFSDTKTKHLTQWLNQNLTINSRDAENYINNQIIEDTKKFAYLVSIENIKTGRLFASRNFESDNRLHTNLTNLPKIIRRFLRFKDDNLVQYDIKCSQPFFLIKVIEDLRKECNIEDKENISYILQNSNTSLYSSYFTEEWNKLKNWILNDDLYEKLSNILVPTKIEPEYKNSKDDFWYRDKLNNYHNNGELKCYKHKVKYKTKRDMIKVIVLNILYGGKTKPCKESQYFKDSFPNLFKVIQSLKTSKNSLPLKLQNMESRCILDHTTKKLSDTYPNMPLFTIHDSILTTKEWSNKIDLKTEIELLIKNYVGYKPQIVKESF